MDATNNDLRNAAAPAAKKLSLRAPSQAALLKNFSDQTGHALPADPKDLTLGRDLLGHFSTVALAALPSSLRSRRVPGPQAEDAPPPVTTEEAMLVGRAVLAVTTMVDFAVC